MSHLSRFAGTVQTALTFAALLTCMLPAEAAVTQNAVVLNAITTNAITSNALNRLRRLVRDDRACYEHKQFFLAEIRRILRPGGKLVIASPDRDACSSPVGPPNPFHVRELTWNEFTARVESGFTHVAFLVQRPIVGSLIVRAKGAASVFDTLTFERHSGDRFEASAGLSRAKCWVAIASDATPLPLPESYYFENE